MRYVSVVWLLPLFFVAQSAEAARISFATKDCGTPPLLGLEFEVLTLETSGLNTVSASTDACPQEAVGSLVGDDGSALYGEEINSLGFQISNPDSFGNVIEFGDFQVSGVNGAFLFADLGLAIECEPRTGLACAPPDLAILLQDFPVGIQFRVTSVNDFTVPEPATLSLLGLGLAAAAVRRRRTTARK